METRLGWTAGVGVEWALWEDWSVKLEYDYYDFGKRNVTFIEESDAFPSGPENIKQTIQTVELGLNFHVSPGHENAISPMTQSDRGIPASGQCGHN